MTSQGQEVTQAPPPEEAPAGGGTPGAWRKYALAAGFLAPAAFFLLVWIVYPTVMTVIRSFYDRPGDSFVGLANYETLFTEERLLTAIRNSALWIFIVPALVTAIGLIFAVLTERVRWAVAFKTAVFMPMAISAFAAGVLWRIMYIQDPERGALNAGISAVRDVVRTPGPLTTATPSTEDLTGDVQQGFELDQDVSPGDTALLGLTAIRAPEIPEDAEQAVRPEAMQGGITGVVWRDFSPGGESEPGRIDEGELGLPGVVVELRDEGGGVVERTEAAADGTFAFEDVDDGTYRLAVGANTFYQPFGGVSWLGPRLVTPSIMIAYIWIWAGFAMVIIAAGLAAISREVLEAARTDGATEWQVFRRITVPMLAPVLTVVFITMLINVIKVFDIVLAIAPGSAVNQANVIALAMWREGFSGVNDFGVASAVAVFLFLLVIPILAINIRRFRREV